MFSSDESMDVSPLSRTISPKPTILVIGMHRSGTSAVAQLISRMGAYAGEPESLVPADEYVNPTGFWERVDVVIEQDRFLKEIGFAWGTIANFHPDRIAPEKRRVLAASLKNIVDGMVSGQSPLVIKDPRLCLLLPIWHDFLGNAVHTVIVRDPRKIAASLMTTFPSSFTTDFLVALWQKYLQIALASLVGKQVLFVSYENLLADISVEHLRLWQGLNSLGAGLSTHELDQVGVLDRSLDRSEPSRFARLDQDQELLFAWLLTQCAAPGPVEVKDVPVIAQPDEILGELERVRRACLNNGWQMALNRSSVSA
jgi:hypothetical protein